MTLLGREPEHLLGPRAINGAQTTGACFLPVTSPGTFANGRSTWYPPCHPNADPPHAAHHDDRQLWRHVAGTKRSPFGTQPAQPSLLTRTSRAEFVRRSPVHFTVARLFLPILGFSACQPQVESLKLAQKPFAMSSCHAASTCRPPAQGGATKYRQCREEVNLPLKARLSKAQCAGGGTSSE